MKKKKKTEEHKFLFKTGNKVDVFINGEKVNKRPLREWKFMQVELDKN